MFELKTYQNETLQILREFLEEARLMPVEEAFTRAQQRQNRQPLPYLHHDFAQVPYVCLRLPTGGGKTVLASYAVGLAKRAYLEQDYPIVLWLVPTNTIREQMLEVLQKPGHPYRAALEDEFGVDRLMVLDIGDVTRIRKQDIGNKAIIVVGTLATLRVEDTSGRKVYAYHEDFEPHCAGISPHDARLEKVSEADLKLNGLTAANLGKIEVFLQGGHVSYKLAEQGETPNLNLIELDIDDTVLVRWLDREVRQADVSPSEMIRWLVQLLGHLTKVRGFSLTALVRSKFLLARAIKDRIAFCRNKAAERGFQHWLFEDSSVLGVSETYQYIFKPDLYPARVPFYRGKYAFTKHYYPVIEDLKNSGEEFATNNSTSFFIRNAHGLQR